MHHRQFQQGCVSSPGVNCQQGHQLHSFNSRKYHTGNISETLFIFLVGLYNQPQLYSTAFRMGQNPRYMKQILLLGMNFLRSRWSIHFFLGHGVERNLCCFKGGENITPPHPPLVRVVAVCHVCWLESQIKRTYYFCDEERNSKLNVSISGA